MASAEGSERYATLNWEIENFDLFLETPTGKCGGFRSPVLKVDQNGGNIWCVLCVRHTDTGIELDMFQIQEVSVNVRCDASIISSCGEVPLQKTSKDALFFIEKDAAFGDKKRSMLHQKALTFRYRIWVESMKNQELRICSALHSIKHRWHIHHFNSSRYYNTVVERDNFLLYVSLKAKSKESTPMVVEMVSNANICVSIVNCTLSSTYGGELMKNKTFHFPYAKWTCDIEKFPENMERITLEFGWIVSLHKVCQTVQHENASKAVPGNPRALSDFLHLYREGTLSDATLNTEGKSFPAHRSILAARSPVFRAMFEKDEMSEGRSGIVDIDDVDSETLDRMLVFLYGEKLDDVQWDEASALYYAADKYDVLSLKRICVDVLRALLAVDNACDMLVLADKHSDVQLRKCVVDFIRDHQEVFSSSKWKKLEKSDSRLTTKILREVYVKEEKVVKEEESERQIGTIINNPKIERIHRLQLNII